MVSAASRVAVALALFWFPVAASAQVIPPSEQPGRERERFVTPPPPLAQPGGPAITLPGAVAPAGAERVKLVLRGVRVDGATVYRAEDFASLYEEFVGREISLKQVYEIAQRVTAKYGNDGYVLSRAVVPPQALNPGGAQIHIQVVEGYVDKVVWPKSLERYRDFFSSYAARITADRPINIRTLERYLLLAGELPGLKFSTSLKPSSDKTGAATLVVVVVEKPIDLYGRVDNRGTKARGPLEFFGSVIVNNLIGQHEALTLSYATVYRPKELQYVAANYRQVLTPEGLTWFVNASYSWGNPGTVQLETLDYRTLGPYADTGFSYPIIRSRERNLTMTGLVFGSNSRSDVFDAPFNDDRLRGVRLKADADAADALMGINQFSVTFSHGFDGLGSTSNDNPLASRTAGRVDFTKVEAFAARTQPLIAAVSAYLAAYGQYAATPLLAPEQCGFGGRFFGRGFDPSELLGDSCLEALAELRLDIAGTPLSQFQFYGYIDYGQLWTRSAAAGTPDNIDAASAGGGVRLGWKYFNADLQAAKALEGPRDDWRFFFIVAAKY